MWRRPMFALVALVATWPALARALPPDPANPDDTPPEPAMQPPDEMAPLPPLAEPDPPLHEDNEFGPVILIEQIDITGNTATETEIIRRALPISAGDVLHASDKRLREARFKVLALGFFRDVTLAMHKGSQRGQVVVEVHVIERGTLVLNRLWFGTASLSPYWIGADAGERNLLGLGVAVGGGFIFAHQADLGEPGETFDGRDQYAAELRLADPSVRGTPWGASWAITLVHGSEPYQVTGGNDSKRTDLRAFPYRRFGMRAGVTYNVSALTRLSTGVRAESIDATLPIGPTRTLGDLTTSIDPHLDPGASRVVTASFGFDRDTRPDPILPHAGSHILASAELGSALVGGSYDFATVFASYEHYWPVFGDKHAIGLKL
ncbi:MAG TPA: BamA/TamA family outer membrane protein, partial [Kofleriaceae bacterium]|nr:BamA/TamA family outer membrane protein [Kofleriaceae bacterium]